MVSFQPAFSPYKQADYSQTTSLSVVQKQTVVTNDQVSTSTSTVEINYQSQTRSHTFLADGVEKYQAIGDTQKTNTAAANILTFIEAQIQRDIADGATEEELASRLQAGLDGFLKGFGEAYEQLQGMGWLVEGVEEAVQQTYDQVTSGIAALAEELGIEPPQGLPESNGSDSDDGTVVDDAPVAVVAASGAEEPAAVSRSDSNDTAIITSFREQQQEFFDNLAPSTTTAAEAGSRKYSFELRTQDGDVVTINAGSLYGKAAHNNGTAIGYAEFNKDYFNFSVTGELDEGELAAINDLLTQVNDVAELFFSGDVYAAYDHVLQIGFDEEEIAQFALHLKQTQVTQVENTYRGVEQADENYTPPANRMAVVSEFVQKLEILHSSLKEMGANYEIALNLFEMIDTEKGGRALGHRDDHHGGQHNRPEHSEQGHKLAPFAQKFARYF